jgi:hypothetical protein
MLQRQARVWQNGYTLRGQHKQYESYTYMMQQTTPHKRLTVRILSPKRGGCALATGGCLNSLQELGAGKTLMRGAGRKLELERQAGVDERCRMKQEEDEKTGWSG